MTIIKIIREAMLVVYSDHFVRKWKSAVPAWKTRESRLILGGGGNGNGR